MESEPAKRVRVRRSRVEIAELIESYRQSGQMQREFCQHKTAIGAFIRRIKARLGAPTAINADAHKLARLFYRLLKFGTAYVEQGQTYYEQKYKEHLLRNLNRRAKEFGFQLTPLDPATASVS